MRSGAWRRSGAQSKKQAPFSTQGWNRYAYVGNSPVNFTDPSGYCFLGCFWKKIGKALGKLLRKFPIIGTILKIAAVALCGGNPICGALVSFATTAFITGVQGGSLGQALKAGAIAAGTVLAFAAVGDAVEGIAGTRGPAFGTPGYIFKVAAHAGVGCVSAMAAGGKCGAGAAGAAVGAASTPFLNTGSHAGNIAAAAVVGGLGSVAAGGKFLDGAATAAFGYMFNATGGQLLGGAAGGYAGGAAGGALAGLCAWITGGACGAAAPYMVSGGAMAGRFAGGVVGSSVEDWLFPPSDPDLDSNTMESRRFRQDDKQKIDQRAVNPGTGKEECFFCGKEVDPNPGNPNSKQYDHWWPFSRGGGTTAANGEVTCAACNGSGGKWYKLPWNWK